MKSRSSIMMVIAVLLSSINSFAQMKNSKTETVSVSGNCGMCKKTIEGAGTSKKTAEVKWDSKTQSATLIYNSEKTNPDEILKRIALAGYDNEKYLAPDNVYAELPACCKYDRMKMESKMDDMSKNTKMEDHSKHTMEMEGEMSKTQEEDHSKHVMNNEPVKKAEEDHSNHSHGTKTVEKSQATIANPFSEVYTHYFALKDALVKSDAVTAATKAKDLVNTINSMKMDNLSTAAHTGWMDVSAALKMDAERIAGTKDVEQQRKSFTSLSTNVYRVMKASSPETTVYYQNCPMYNNGKGANWLSKESGIKNPYLGSSMLTCGKTIETIK